MTLLHMGAEQFRRQLAELLNRVGYGGDQVIVERHGTPIAVLLPYSTFAAWEKSSGDKPVADQVVTLAAELEQARLAAGLSCEDMARTLQEDRLRTLREQYPEFLAAALATSPHAPSRS